MNLITTLIAYFIEILTATFTAILTENLTMTAPLTLTLSVALSVALTASFILTVAECNLDYKGTGASLLLQRLFVHSTVTQPMTAKECVQCVHSV